MFYPYYGFRTYISFFHEDNQMFWVSHFSEHVPQLDVINTSFLNMWLLFCVLWLSPRTGGPQTYSHSVLLFLSQSLFTLHLPAVLLMSVMMFHLPQKKLGSSSDSTDRDSLHNPGPWPRLHSRHYQASIELCTNLRNNPKFPLKLTGSIRHLGQTDQIRSTLPEVRSDFKEHQGYKEFCACGQNWWWYDPN